ncbi:uncharacterized protein L969DRAFT_475276 [Mixia osmundae IAM 14324]|uniref:Haloacid dehalogenase-like hydrolase domain-containing protein 3 n=1 Tax=Mixia osmundae (strain CBS 9802 / IAM 14324 / JCM 22182 / KY 12970) TaxID=764103 RepID=G7E1X8_MIXOS|nr:uncharacterized protein L969DRAFT_475276 [Mixia osmundae IAM 14324]KEI38652.1 hypothetical protein L969DRAFT_475276 [Mixia osmundae IAM 14324]GAA96891.1 hypothetical protein E5Q_03564 [Mixia osmundae IAM 14324]
MTAGIRLILFDAFGTLLKPRTAPHSQYADEARRQNLVVKDNDVQRTFKQAFRRTNAEYPNYGQPQLDPSRWWSLVIERTFEDLVTGNELQTALPGLTSALIQRFSSSRAYELYEDVRPALATVKSGWPGIELGVLSNTDPCLHDVLKSLGLSDEFLAVQTSWALRVAKPDPLIFLRAIQDSFRPDQVLYVGDDPEEDYDAACKAGLRSVWLKRPGLGAKGWDDQFDEECARETIASLADLSDWLRQHSS